MKQVQMLKHSHLLNPGEFAGFEDEVADALIAAGFAEAVEEDPAKEEVRKRGRKPAQQETQE